MWGLVSWTWPVIWAKQFCGQILRWLLLFLLLQLLLLTPHISLIPLNLIESNFSLKYAQGIVKICISVKIVIYGEFHTTIQLWQVFFNKYYWTMKYSCLLWIYLVWFSFVTIWLCYSLCIVICLHGHRTRAILTKPLAVDTLKCGVTWKFYMKKWKILRNKEKKKKHIWVDIFCTGNMHFLCHFLSVFMVT